MPWLKILSSKWFIAIGFTAIVTAVLGWQQYRIDTLKIERNTLRNELLISNEASRSLERKLIRELEINDNIDNLSKERIDEIRDNSSINPNTSGFLSELHTVKQSISQP